MNASIYATSESIINAQLRDGEQVLWSGQPRKGVMLRPTDVFLIPFSLLWGGFAFFWEFMVIRTPSPFFMKLWGIPFCLMGLYIIFGRFFFEARHRDGTHYGVTNDRILIATGNGKQVKSLSLRTLGDVSVEQKTDGSGTITLGANPFGMAAMASAQMFPAGMGGGRYAPPSFEMIPNVRQVYDIILDGQSKAR